MAKILVVDDDLMVLATISLGLRKAGYDVTHVGSGLSAIQMVRRERPDLVVLDIRMPGLNGIETAKVLKAEFNVPFIFLTAFSDQDMVQEAVLAGGLGYLVKPIEIARIVPAVEVALVRAQEFAQLELDNTDLSAALERNREIDVALGLLMGRSRLCRADAFESLCRYARNHRYRIADVAQRLIVGEDIPDLLDSSQIGIIFLDPHFAIKRFNRQAAKLFRLADSDLGRPLRDIKPLVVGENVRAHAEAVLDSLVPWENEVRMAGNQWFLIRVIPYRAEDNRIDGVVLIFTDISRRKQAGASQLLLDTTQEANNESPSSSRTANSGAGSPAI